MDLLPARRKLGLGAAVYDMHLRAQAQRRAGRIHRHVAAADHASAPSDMDGCQVVVPVRVHQVVARQELVGREDAAQVLAGYAHELGSSRAGAYEHGRETLLAEQLVHGHGTSYYHVGLYLHPEPAHIVNLAGEHLLLRKPELGNAVDQHPARLVQGFENRHVVAQLGEVARAGQTCGAGADNGDLHAVRGGLGRLFGSSSVFTHIVGHETLQLAYRHRLALHSEHAAAFALGLLGAHASADRRQGRIAGNHLCGALHVLLRQSGDEIRNLEIHGAGGHTARILAVQAAARLEKGLLLIVTVAYLVEIGRADLGVLLAHRNPGNSVCHYLSLPILHSCLSSSSFSSFRNWP